MTANQTNISSEIESLSINNSRSKPNVISKTPQPKTSQKLSTKVTTHNPQNNNPNSTTTKHKHSQSQPNQLKSINPLNINAVDSHNPLHNNLIIDPNNNSYTDTAYNYATSYATSAYSYISSFYPSPDANENDPNDTNDTNDQHNTNNDKIHHLGLPQHSKSLSSIRNGSITNGHHLKCNNSNNNYDPSIPDTKQYPMTEIKGNASSDSNLCLLLKNVCNNGIDVAWSKHFSQPICDSVLLRTKTYKMDGKKKIDSLGDGSPIFKLAHAQAFKTEIMMDHIAMHPLSWYNQNISLDDMSCFTIIVHLQVKSLKTSFITYHVLTAADKLLGYNSHGTPIVRGDKSVTKLLDLILNCNNNKMINNRLKLIPRVRSGPYPVKRVVENRPVLLGNKVPHKYYRGSNYFEIDSRVDESMVAASIIKLCHRFAKRIVVDMAWTIQGEEINELPERLICGCSLHNMDFSKCKDVNYEIQNCPKLKYKTYNDEEKQDNK